MYASKQLDPFFDLINKLHQSADATGCSDDLTVVSQAALLALHQEAVRLQGLNQRLVIGSHEHKFGESTYLFLVPQGVEFGEDDLEVRLEEEFEPEEEFLRVEQLEEPEVIVARSSL